MSEKFPDGVRDLMGFLWADDITQKPPVIDPWLPQDGLAMISAPTGVGKTMLSLTIALHLAHGNCGFLGWDFGEPRRVLYVDGEMSLTDMQTRLWQLVRGLGWDDLVTLHRINQHLFFFSDADTDDGIESLESVEGRDHIDRMLISRDIEVLILDNYSALMNSAEENDAKSWTPIQEWFLTLRASHINIIMIHHTGKVYRDRESGELICRQRGTSKREDIMNTTIVLEPGKVANQFRVNFTKHRSFLPPELWAQMLFEGADGEATCKIVEKVSARRSEKKVGKELERDPAQEKAERMAQRGQL